MRRYLLTATVTTAFLAAPPALAQEAADDGVEDVTMEVMEGQGESEAEFVDRIELPDRASDTARERAAPGRERGGDAGERGRGDERRPGEAAREAAQTAREARERDEPDDPDDPETPD